MDVQRFLDGAPQKKRGAQKNDPGKLVTEGQEIALAIDEDPTADIGFHTPYLIHCTLPHSRPKESPFVRSTPWVEVRLASTDGIPYGPIARLYYVWVLTQAIRQKSPSVLVAKSLADLARSLHLPSDGRTYRRLRQQLRNCCSALWSIRPLPREVPETGRLIVREEHWHLARASEYQVDPKNPDQLGLFDLRVELSPEFWQAVQDRAAPFSMRALIALKGSSLAMDFYLWANLKAHSLKEPQKIPYRALMAQFGAGYDPANKKHRNRFQQRLSKQIRHVSAVWPGLRVEQVPGAVQLRPSQPHIRLLK